MAVSDADREEAAAYLRELLTSSRTRDDTIRAVLALKAMESGTLLLNIPRAPGKPIDGSVILGGLSARFTDERAIAS